MSKTESRSGLPRWVKLFLLAALILLLVLVALHLSGNGFGNHMDMSTLPSAQQASWS